MRVGILGPLQVMANGNAIAIGGSRLRTLMVRLALDPGRIITADALGYALWHDNQPSDPANALQSLVSRLRHVLPPDVVVRSEPGGYRLELAAEAVDAIRFERLAREGRRALRDGRTRDAAERLRDALALWRGEPLADVAGAPFAAAAIARLSELRLAAVEDRVEAELDAAWETSVREPANLVAELEELAALHPLRERLHGLLIKALHADGRQPEALAAFEAFRRRLADELGADPGPDTRNAHLAVLRDDRVATRRRASPRPRGNLRTPLTTFVGRTQEQTRIAKQLEQGRLVTLVGPGGAGKTRLATTFAAGIAGEVPGGVWLVELASVTDPADVPQAMIAALGLREIGVPEATTTPHDSMTRLVEALSATQALVVLDNCEHLIAPVAQLVDDLLGRCPQLRVLATSREPLGLLGEALCPVTPLALPERGATAAEAAGHAAVQLFADRAAAVRPEFTVAPDNVGAVIEICRRLDGLPLAIELAAARLRSLPIAHVAALLGDRFRLLTGGNRTALPRHQTLRGVVAWSWSLLDDRERRFVERLAVFPADITVEAAERVGDPGDGTLEMLAALVDKSLLQMVEGPQPRYRMLETIREFGRERLAEAGQIAQVRAAHVAYVLDLAETAEPHVRGPGQMPWIARLVVERDNLIAALHFACDAGDAVTAVRLGSALGLFWTIQGNHAQAASWLRLALDVPGDAPHDAKRAAAAIYLFNAVLSGGDVRPNAPVEHLGTPPDSAARHPASALYEPAVSLVADDVAEGLAVIDQRRSHPDPWTRAMLLLIRAMVGGNSGAMEGMRRDLAAAVTAFRQAGERWGLATSLTYLASTRKIFGDFESAISGLEESIRVLRELDPSDDAVLQRVWIADARRQLGDVEQARADLLDVVDPRTGASSASSLAFARITLGDLARYDGDLDEAGRQYDLATGDLARVPFETPLNRAMLGTAMAHLAVTRGRVEGAQRHLAEAFALATQSPDMPLVAVVAVGIARLRWCTGTAGIAAQVLGAAHALRGAPDAYDPDVAALAAELRDDLGARAYDAAYARGRGLDRHDALALIEAQLR